MSRKNHRSLAERVIEAAEDALSADNYVSAVDVFGRIGWLHAAHVEAWQRGKAACLADAIQIPASRMAEALDVMRSWASAKGLISSETAYVGSTPRRAPLRFVANADPGIEQLCRTRWMPVGVPEKTRQRPAQKASREPELVVVESLKGDWKCRRCGGTGAFLMMENIGPACLPCVGLGDLTFLGAGDALLTRRARTKSARYAVVVRFSRRRRRYERQGLLVEPQALAEAERELAEERKTTGA